jgi:hypothetical protein
MLRALWFRSVDVGDDAVRHQGAVPVPVPPVLRPAGSVITPLTVGQQGGEVDAVKVWDD